MTRPLPSYSRRPAALLTWLLACGLLLTALLATAQQVPPRPSPPRLVNDLADLLTPEQEQALEQKLVAYNDSTSSQFAVVTVPNLGGDEIANYAQRLFESWGIGQKEKNNGLLILVARDERKVNIHTGYGLEGAIPDALAKRIISNVMVPAFKAEQYYDGIDGAVDRLFALAAGEYKAEPRAASDDYGDEGGSSWTFWVIIGLLVLFLILRSRGGGGGRGGRRSGGFGGGFFPPIILGGGGFGGGGFGGGGFGGGGGGGFGGFGGGSSGGGGASGSW
ncbi:TPM domain-containing protein [Hymenobacter sp. 15J16-1T3B]|uniref:TPM domain-containing protein n=1 Tax=Hymenobacter sp. 15J16-1T3B TaxID=2886941 RepID=UPI001D103DC4|nr:TPM domain-containing protein [Hymenobacter sp. 15J16-1T3B]MCC3155826.1 TPM domain-containing protein [Hymenobacter sp. 15J16-1T3B]